MKANEFVKKHGLNEVKKILQCAPDFALSILDDGDETDLCDLKRLVESHDPVESHDGLDAVKQYLDSKHVLCWNALDGQLSLAVRDVEACQ